VTQQTVETAIVQHLRGGAQRASEAIVEWSIVDQLEMQAPATCRDLALIYDA
jgi:hypothetical protein